MPHGLIRLDRDSSEPLYRQVRGALDQAIVSGVLAAGERLPSSRDLAVELSVSRNTINLAYQELVSSGAVVARTRRGLFVNPDMTLSRSMETPSSEPAIEWSGRFRPRLDRHLPEIEKPLEWHDYPYPFLAGQGDVQSFPARAWIRCLREALYHPHIYPSLQDSIGADDPMLVEEIRTKLLPSRGIEVDDADNILITVGSQQGLDLLTRVLHTEGARVGVEDPGYLDAQHIFAGAGAELVPCPIDERGVRVTDDPLDWMYLTPSHHHPTNVTMSMDRRVRLLQRAAQTGMIVIEDDYDSEFRYQGSPSPALKALDRAESVVYLGTFSKFLSPGLRLGFIVGPAPLIREIRQVRRYVIRHPSGHQQRALALLIQSGEYHRAVRRYRRRLMEKWSLMTSACAELLPWEQEPYPPGGVSLWMTGPHELDARELSARVREEGVLFEPGDIYFAGPQRPTHHFRLGYAAVPSRAIQSGVQILAQHARELLG